MTARTKRTRRPRHPARMFTQGERVRISRKSRVVDEKREFEGADPATLPAIDQDVTGLEGEVYGESYDSPEKGVCTPIMLPNGAVISVPENRLERADKSVRRIDGGGQSFPSSVSRETVEFWREYFRRKGELKGEEE